MSGKIKAICSVFSVLLCVGIVIFSAVQIVDIQTGRAAARQEYDRLREQIDGMQAGGEAEDESASLLYLLEINPDFVGWLKIPGTEISYPVTQGKDNSKYLHTTFAGEQNGAGAIFMDCSAAEQFEAQHAILYGHNMKDGTMFAGLEDYLDAEYLAEHPTIEITLPDGALRTYRIFAARVSDAEDAAYRAAFADEGDFAAFAAALGAPEGADHILTLSTCTSGGADTDRILVHALVVLPLL